MALLSCRNLSIAYSGPRLLDDAGLTIEKLDRVCLIGRNGEGKSTLLRILSGESDPDSGQREAIPDLRITKLDQEVPEGLDGTVFDIVAQGLGTHAKIVADYHKVAHDLAETPDNSALSAKLDSLQLEIEQKNLWSIENKVNRHPARRTQPQPRLQFTFWRKQTSHPPRPSTRRRSTLLPRRADKSPRHASYPLVRAVSSQSGHRPTLRLTRSGLHSQCRQSRPRPRPRHSHSIQL